MIAGVRDLDASQLVIYDYIFQKAKECFECRGAVKIDTPIFEKLEPIKNAYGGEFDKYVFKIEGEDLILRYDLTIPFVRYVSMKGIKKIRKYQIGRVYRKDIPQISIGRLCEFYQCDFDIVGSTDENESLTQDIEIIDLVQDLLFKLIGNNFLIKINFRNIATEYLNNMGISIDNIPAVLTSLDKLDKHDIDYVCDELKKKDLDSKIIVKLREFINTEHNLINMRDMKLISEETFIKFENILNKFSILNENGQIIFDPLLARGLDYYTGLIFEVLYNDRKVMPSTICAGGRYDKLIDKFSNFGNITAIGMSLGVERIFTILQNDNKIKKSVSNTACDVYICSLGSTAFSEKLKLSFNLRRLNIRTVISTLESKKIKKQLKEAVIYQPKFFLILGEEEISKKIIQVKNFSTKEQFTLPISEVSSYLLKVLV